MRQAFGLGANLQSGYAFGVATFVMIWKNNFLLKKDNH